MIRSLRPEKGLLIPSYGTVALDIITFHPTQRRLPVGLDPNPVRKSRQSIDGRRVCFLLASIHLLSRTLCCPASVRIHVTPVIVLHSASDPP